LDELKSIRIKPFNLPLERDRWFSPITVKELYEKLNKGEHV
jgi:hypothetical protein